MNIVLLGKRGIILQKLRRGEQTVILIPSPDTTKIYKEINDTSAIAERYGVSGQIPLWREVLGQVSVYGVLPEELAHRTQAMKVWLVQDFIPPGTTAFYIVFDERHMVHGRREVDDEGKEEWRVTLMKAENEEKLIKMLSESAVEMMVENTESTLCVAVFENVTLHDTVKETLKPLAIQPVPFSSLKLSSRLKPLYKHQDYTWLIVVGVMLTMAVLATAVFYWLMAWTQQSALDSEIQDIRQSISSVQINKSIGDIMDPEAVLHAMRKTFDQKPSAIVDAAARIGKEFGDLESVVFQTSGASDGMAVKGDEIHPILEGQRKLRVTVSKPTNDLLVEQEKLAHSVVSNTTWLQRIEKIPSGKTDLVLDMVLQVEKTKGEK